MEHNTSTVREIAAKRGIDLTSRPDVSADPALDAPITILCERASDVTVTVAGDERTFRVYAGWIKVINTDGSESTVRPHPNLRPTLPVPVVTLTRCLARVTYAVCVYPQRMRRAAQFRHLVATTQEAGWARTPQSLFIFDSSSMPHDWRYAGYVWKDWQHLVAFTKRYQRRCYYITETSVDWHPDPDRPATYWADNSVDVHEINKHGHRRTRQTTAPHGDLCF